MSNNVDTKHEYPVIDFTKFNHCQVKPSFIKLDKLTTDEIVLTIKLAFASSSKHNEIKAQLTEFIQIYLGENQQFFNGKSPTITINFQTEIIPHKVKVGLQRIKNIKNIIAVTSGKGGVGKSTTALNLACALSQNGAKVGLLDADIYGPSLPRLVNATKFKPDVEGACFVPLEKYGLKLLSFGFLIAEEQPAIWRGAIVNKALDQLLFDTKWGELDYLVIDMPPGTGDIHLTMCQKMPITATLVVTTPQDIALVDVGKSIAMYNKLGIPCLGVVENMSVHICSNCGHKEEIFGVDGAKRLHEQFGLNVLAKLPLSLGITHANNNGCPVTYCNLDSVVQKSNVQESLMRDCKVLSEIYNELAIKVGFELSKLGKDYSAVIGKVEKVK